MTRPTETTVDALLRQRGEMVKLATLLRGLALALPGAAELEKCAKRVERWARIADDAARELASDATT